MRIMSLELEQDDGDEGESRGTPPSLTPLALTDDFASSKILFQ